MIRIIPAIDIIEGQVVRLRHGDFTKKTTYQQDPLAIAKSYQDIGIKYLHLVDLDGAKAGHIINWQILDTLVRKTSLSIDFGGGIRSDRDIAIALDNGANQVTVGSIAVRNREKVNTWIKKYGSDKLILGADVINNKIAVSAWQDQTELDIYNFIHTYAGSGITDCICTDVSRDGDLQGPAIELYQEIKKRFPDLFIIASGGISSVEDIVKLDNAAINGVIIGKALLEERISLNQLMQLVC
jgi:phosphoribosylformimino-5-aminoimidazole carboxamide ribotide isomerase